MIYCCPAMVSPSEGVRFAHLVQVVVNAFESSECTLKCVKWKESALLLSLQLFSLITPRLIVSRVLFFEDMKCPAKSSGQLTADLDPELWASQTVRPLRAQLSPGPWPCRYL